MEEQVTKKLLTLADVQDHPAVRAYIRKSNENLGSLGFTEHGFRHTEMVAQTASRIMQEMGFSLREAELAAVAGYLHDIGNVVERSHHYYTGALIAMRLLAEMGMEELEIAEVAAAIGNHDEVNGRPVSNVSAAVILADKADVHRSRVRSKPFSSFDIHDRVNYAVQESLLELEPDQRVIRLKLVIDTNMSGVMEYFEIFLTRMIMCRRAADFLSSHFSLVINEAQLL